MGFLNSIFKKAPKITKMHVAGKVASIVDYVIQDAGMSMLCSGSLVLKTGYTVHFSSGEPKKTAETLAIVPVASIPEGRLFEQFIELGKVTDLEFLDHLTSPFSMAVIEAFSQQCPEFSRIDAGSYY